MSKIFKFPKGTKVWVIYNDQPKEVKVKRHTYDGNNVEYALIISQRFSMLDWDVVTIKREDEIGSTIDDLFNNLKKQFKQ